MAIFVHLCWMFRVLYLGPILLSFTESEKTLPRNHLKLWTSRYLLKCIIFFLETDFSKRGPKVTKLPKPCDYSSFANSPATQALFHLTIPTAPDFILLRKIHYSISTCTSKSTSKLICDLLSLYQPQETSNR